MNIDQAIETLREFRLLNLGPRLSEAIDVVVAELERNPFRSSGDLTPDHYVPLGDGSYVPLGSIAPPRHNMARSDDPRMPPAGFYNA